MMKRVLWSQRKKEIICSLKSMLTGMQHSVSVWKTRKGLNVYACYEDFLTEEEMSERIKSIVGQEASITVVRTYSENFTKDTLYRLFCSGDSGILYTEGESLESAPIRRYVGRMMRGINRGERPANFSM